MDEATRAAQIALFEKYAHLVQANASAGPDKRESFASLDAITDHSSETSTRSLLI